MAPTATSGAVPTAANISWFELGADLAAGLSVVVTSGATGTEPGNITELTPNIAFINAAGTSLTIQSGAGAGLVGNITITDLRLNGSNSSIVVMAANNVSIGKLEPGFFGAPPASVTIVSGGAILDGNDPPAGTV